MQALDSASDGFLWPTDGSNVLRVLESPGPAAAHWQTAASHGRLVISASLFVATALSPTPSLSLYTSFCTDIDVCNEWN